jgi:hypothetical protein
MDDGEGRFGGLLDDDFGEEGSLESPGPQDEEITLVGFDELETVLPGAGEAPRRPRGSAGGRRRRAAKKKTARPARAA